MLQPVIPKITLQGKKYVKLISVQTRSVDLVLHVFGFTHGTINIPCLQLQNLNSSRFQKELDDYSKNLLPCIKNLTVSTVHSSSL